MKAPTEVKADFSAAVPDQLLFSATFAALSGAISTKGSGSVPVRPKAESVGPTARTMSDLVPAPGYETRALKAPGGDRTPLVIATGTSAAGKWSAAKIIDGPDEPTAGYCYTAIHFTTDAVLLAYCAGGDADKSRLARLRVRKVPLAALP